LDGSSCEWWQRIAPTTSSNESATLAPAECNVAAETRPKSRRGVTLGVVCDVYGAGGDGSATGG
jgi:hypothetical protein